MIRISQQDSAAAAKSYYSKADYYSEGQELVGSWGGKGADRLGLSGTVDKDSFERLCDNLDPTNRRATDGPHAGRTHASVMTSPSRCPRAFRCFTRRTRRPGHPRCLPRRRSMRRCARWKREMKTRVRTGGQDINRITGNMVWAEFIHTTSRPVDGIPDPAAARPCLRVQHDVGPGGASLEGRPDSAT